MLLADLIVNLSVASLLIATDHQPPSKKGKESVVEVVKLSVVSLKLPDL